MISGRKIPMEEMTIDALNYIDEERDYFEWKHRKTHGITSGLELNVVIQIIEKKMFCGFYCL